ncbi:MAG: protease modulator HflC [Geminicoccaceae bacterium]
MSRLAMAGLIIVGLALFGLYNSLFTVHETRQALVLQFGQFIKTVTEPGLHFKLPFVQNAVYIDRRVLDFDAPPQEVILGDQKRLVVDAFARYRISDARRFYQTVRDEAGMLQRINTVLDASLRKVLGDTPLFTVLSSDRSSLMDRIQDDTNNRLGNFGVEVVDVRIKRADLPPENSEAIYRRMQTERERQAKELRAQGYELGQRIRASADRERRVIIAEAQKKAQIIRGRGDGLATKIFADAYGKDIEFFTFYRSMEAYRGALGDDTTSFVLSPEGEFFRFFDNAEPNRPREASNQSEPSRVVPGQPDRAADTPLTPDQTLGQILGEEPTRIE